jgi:hypothetical protein
MILFLVLIRVLSFGIPSSPLGLEFLGFLLIPFDYFSSAYFDWQLIFRLDVYLSSLLPPLSTTGRSANGSNIALCTFGLLFPNIVC